MTHRIEVITKPKFSDPIGNSVKSQIQALGLPVEDVRVTDVYTIEGDLSHGELERLGQELFADPVTQFSSVDRPPVGVDYDWSIEVGYLPGVTDNVGRSAREAMKDLGVRLGEDERVYTSRRYLVSGDFTQKQLEEVAGDVLANRIIQGWNINDKPTFQREHPYLPAPRIQLAHEPTVASIDLDVSDGELLRISSDRLLALNLPEMQIIKDHFSGQGRSPTDAELEVLAQTWSEHCIHKIFNARVSYDDGAGNVREIDGLFPTFIKASTFQLQQQLPWILSVLWDNSGVIRFNDDWLLSVKCETHNSPSKEDPYGGSITGIVGVYRDPMGTGKGARLIYGTYGFCPGNPFYDGPLRPRIHPARLLEGVRKGVEDGGNKSGIPTPYGRVFFNDGNMGKPAIFVLATGIIPSRINGKPGYEKRVNSGDKIVMAGGKVGIDGIHGATQSSMESGKWITRGHVQIGDPYTQKNLLDFMVEARDKGLYRGITDNGAGGLSSSVGETAYMFADEGGANGSELHLDRVPLKYAGLDPWQILVSESQQRMTFAVPNDSVEKLLKLARKHNVEATVIGRYTDSGRFNSLHRGETATDMDIEFMSKGVPKMSLNATWIPPEDRGLREPDIRHVKDHGELLRQMLACPNVASTEYITRQFDHEVQGTSVIKPMVGKKDDVNSDAVVLRPDPRTMEGIAISAGLNPDYSEIDTYHMTALALEESIRRVIAVGGSLEQIALNDNFCWPSPLPSENNPDAEYRMAQLVRANQALYDYTLGFKTPCISGKDSMSMDGMIPDINGREHRISAPPTIQFSAVGKIHDIRKCVTMDVKRPGDLVYVIGLTGNELGGSEFYRMNKEVGLNVPRVDIDRTKRILDSTSRSTDLELVHSAHGLYKGGLGVALAKTSFAGGYGMDIDLGEFPLDGVERNHQVLYSESPARLIVTIPQKSREVFEGIMQGLPYAHVGYVNDGPYLRVRGLDGKPIIEEDINDLKRSWQSTFGR